MSLEKKHWFHDTIQYKSVVGLQFEGHQIHALCKVIKCAQGPIFFSADHLANPFCISGPMVMHKLFTINYLELRGWALISHDYNRVRNIRAEIQYIYSTFAVLLTDPLYMKQYKIKLKVLEWFLLKKKKKEKKIFAFCTEREQSKTWLMKTKFLKSFLWQATSHTSHAADNRSVLLTVLYFYFSKYFVSPPYSTVPR